MKANELMIGDWVFCNGECTVVDITHKETFDIVGLEYSGEYDVFHIKDIKPIPLTPEILEKNGFGFTRNNNTDSVWNGWWIYEGLELAVANLNKEGNWPCFINIYDSNILCEYVHQLQHALRLCGIEKEIVLR